MKVLVSSILLCACSLGGSVLAQTLPRLSDLGLMPIATATYFCEEENFSLSLEMVYEDGRVSQFHGTSDNGEAVVQFNPLQMTVVGEDMPEVVYKDIVLNEAGCAVSWTTCLGDTREFQCSATYNEKNQLILMEREEGESVALTWTDDNLTHYEIHFGGSGYESFDITYTDQLSNGLIVRAVAPGFDAFGFFPYSGLMGVTSRNLPSRTENRWGSDVYYDTNELDYEFDQYGRVTCVKTCLNEVHTDYTYFTYPEDTDRLDAITNINSPSTRKTTQGIVLTLPDGTQRVYDYRGIVANTL